MSWRKLFAVLVALVIDLTPIVIGVVFYEATSKPRDANIGGGMVLLAGFAVGIGGAAWLYGSLTRTRGGL